MTFHRFGSEKDIFCCLEINKNRKGNLAETIRQTRVILQTLCTRGKGRNDLTLHSPPLLNRTNRAAMIYKNPNYTKGKK